eukprot:Ihof_evm4s158 gene=Ihof_evmTU4s158
MASARHMDGFFDLEDFENIMAPVMTAVQSDLVMGPIQSDTFSDSIETLMGPTQSAIFSNTIETVIPEEEEEEPVSQVLQDVKDILKTNRSLSDNWNIYPDT